MFNLERTHLSPCGLGHDWRMDNGLREFLTVLNIGIETVDDLDGECATYDHVTRTVTVCKIMCGRRKRAAIDDALSDVSM